MSVLWRVGRVVRHSSAKAATPVRVRYAPPMLTIRASGGMVYTADLKSVPYGVRVRVPPRPPTLAIIVLLLVDD